MTIFVMFRILTRILNLVNMQRLIFARYIFPGLALGAALGQTGVVTDGMITKSAEVCITILQHTRDDYITTY